MMAEIIHQAMLTERMVCFVHFIGLTLCAWVVVVETGSWFCGRFLPSLISSTFAVSCDRICPCWRARLQVEAATEIMAGLEQSEAAAVGGFQSTHWSLVLAAIDINSPRAEDALRRLCEAYWYPAYVFIRRRGSEAELAKYLTQEFFSRLIAKQDLRFADREKGRFRTFVMACVEHFLSNERKKGQT